jgi:transposase
MRGTDHQQSSMFSYISAEQRVPKDHPLRALRVMADAALAQLGPAFDAIYARSGRPSIAPEKLLRALLLQVLYTVRSERLLMEQLDYNFLFRWFVGLSIDDPVWDATVFTKNRERLLEGEVAQGFFTAVLTRPVRMVCSLTSISRSTGRLSKRGRDTRASSAKIILASTPRPTIPAIPASTFTVNGAATSPTNRPPIPRPAWPARARARRPSSATPATC